jgi:hypothetical protein
MNKLLAAIVISTFALGSVTGFAADAGKRDELTQDQRADMRNRADKLTAERAAAASHVTTGTKHTHKAKKQHAGKAHKSSGHHAKKTQAKL